MHNSFKIFFLISVASLLLIILATVPPDAMGEDEVQIWVHGKGNCKHGVHRQANGPMAVILFCEDAVGTYLGLVYYDVMESPEPEHFVRRLSEEDLRAFFKNWSLGNRMWQEPIWASSVTSYAWGKDDSKLYVATSSIYGSGALYELDIVRRNYRQIEPAGKQATMTHPGPGYEITRMDLKQGKLFYRSIPWDRPKGVQSEEQCFDMGK